MTDTDRVWLLNTLKRGAMTDAAMADALDRSIVTIQRWRKENAAALYVAGYVADQRGRMFTRAWAYGPGKADAPRPGQALTGAQRMARSRREKKAAKK